MLTKLVLSRPDGLILLFLRPDPRMIGPDEAIKLRMVNENAPADAPDADQAARRDNVERREGDADIGRGFFSRE